MSRHPSAVTPIIAAADMPSAIAPGVMSALPLASVAGAQADMRHGYCSGGFGILVSALAWTAATVAALAVSPQRAVWVLLIGGACIHPVSVVACRLFGAPGRHASRNALAPMAATSTAWLILCLPLAYAVGLQDASWFFASMLLVIGGRYLVLATLFGMRLHGALGLVLAGVGVASAWLGGPAPLVAAGGAVTEWIFGSACIASHLAWQRARAALPASGSS